ncbi:MAG TPA: hypothetical protein DCE56_23615 [Cyanobacteria bacterium UBA8553]|nr:hypothetical protein [Cyanobacteria bacterium UBA8553]HAJ60510.1 hypothetical protein [Cyanobacteria bacterium UBA8543]
MRKILVSIALWGSLAASCQNSDLTSTSQTGEASSTRTSTDTLASTSAKTAQSSNKSEGKSSSSSPGKNPVAKMQNRPSDRQQTCQISAYVIDKDPKGLNVRSGPGERYKIIGNLPTNTIGVIVNLSASQGDWVQLTKAESPEKTVFQGTGWVYSQLLGTSTRGYGSEGVSVYPSASTESSAVGRIPPGRSAKLLSCTQSWALVEYEGLKGWIAPDAQCPNPLTTCP